MSSREKMYERIVAWNLDRNGLKLDPNLEATMLMEEALEVLTAETPAERLREFADFMFVVAGTAAKVDANAIPDTDAAMTRLGLVTSSVVEALRAIIEHDGTGGLIWDAVDIICDANDNKPKDPTSGKVVKGPDYVDPIAQIEALVKKEAN